nr:AlNc14C672G12387 [Albugo laibachii Nc14]|eukprot:CCA27773.1 AlNc14C672G12387 [Albugo laibachii Nc14]
MQRTRSMNGLNGHTEFALREAECSLPLVLLNLRRFAFVQAPCYRISQLKMFHLSCWLPENAFILVSSTPEDFLIGFSVRRQVIRIGHYFLALVVVIESSVNSFAEQSASDIPTLHIG